MGVSAMKTKKGYGWLLLVMLGWALLPGASAAPKSKHKAHKGNDDDGPLITLKEIPVLTNSPDKNCYAVFHGKAYDALMLARTLNVEVYIKDSNGERIDKPIIVGSRYLHQPNHRHAKDWMVFTGFRKLAPPALNPPKLVITAVNEGGVTVVQTWKFSDNKIVVENTVGSFTAGDNAMRMFVAWPRTHKFTPNVEQEERIKAVAGYTMRWRAGKNENSLKTITAPYGEPMANQPIGDWVENQGPWGARKVTIKRLGGRGAFTLGPGLRCPYDGMETVFVCKPVPKKGVDDQGFELKVE
jgi:hypothetical protein